MIFRFFSTFLIFFSLVVLLACCCCFCCFFWCVDLYVKRFPLILMCSYSREYVRNRELKVFVWVYMWPVVAAHHFWFISVSSGCFGSFDRSSCLNGMAFSSVCVSNIITLKLILICVSMRSAFRASVWAEPEDDDGYELSVLIFFITLRSSSRFQIPYYIQII